MHQGDSNLVWFWSAHCFASHTWRKQEASDNRESATTIERRGRKPTLWKTQRKVKKFVSSLTGCWRYMKVTRSTRWCKPQSVEKHYFCPFKWIEKVLCAVMGHSSHWGQNRTMGLIRLCLQSFWGRGFRGAKATVLDIKTQKWIYMPNEFQNVQCFSDLGNRKNSLTKKGRRKGNKSDTYIPAAPAMLAAVTINIDLFLAPL